MVEFADLALPVCDITIESPSHVEMPPGMHGPGRGWLSFSLSLSLSLSSRPRRSPHPCTLEGQPVTRTMPRHGPYSRAAEVAV